LQYIVAVHSCSTLLQYSESTITIHDTSVLSYTPDVFTCVMWRIHTYARDPFKCVVWRIHMWHGSLIYVTWLIRVGHDSSMYLWKKEVAVQSITILVIAVVGKVLAVNCYHCTSRFRSRFWTDTVHPDTMSSELQRVAASCSVLQCVAACCSGLQWVALGCSELQCARFRFWTIAVHPDLMCSELQWVAVCCSVL